MPELPKLWRTFKIRRGGRIGLWATVETGYKMTNSQWRSFERSLSGAEPCAELEARSIQFVHIFPAGWPADSVRY